MLFLLPPLLLAGAARPCAGQALPPPADTARRTVQLPAARVDGLAAQTVSSVQLADNSPHGTYVTRLVLGHFGPGASLSTVLAQTTPLVVRQYGPGQLASLSVRGTGPQHVALLWNGFNINFPTLGQADLSLLPAAALTSATLLHGPDAARNGSGALGGALTLTTADEQLHPTGAGAPASPPPPFQPRGAAALSTGAFGARAASGRFGAAFRRHAFSTSVQAARATNDFPYRFRTFRGWQSAHQVNAGTASYSFTHDHTLQLGSDWRLTAAAWLTGANRRIAPALNTPNTAAREHDASQRLLLGLTYRATTLRVASLTDVIDYADNLTGPSDSRSHSWQTQLQSALELPRYALTLRGGLEAQYFRARATGYGVGLKTESRAAAFGELAWTASPRLNATLTVRQALLPGYRVPLTPTLKTDWQALPGPNLHVWGSLARAYRAPTLNERYWQPGGNPALRPELSDGYQAGASIAPPRQVEIDHHAKTLFRAEVVAFDQRVHDWVQWTPDAATGLWSPRNLRRVRSRGVEGNLEVSLSGHPPHRGTVAHTSLRLAGQLLQTQKTAGTPTDPDPIGIQLPYVPTRTSSVNLTHQQPLGAALTLLADLTGTRTSRRNTTASGTETLPGYGLLNAGLATEWLTRPATLTLRLDAFNLLNAEYQSQANRPMPSRSWQLTLGLRYD